MMDVMGSRGRNVYWMLKEYGDRNYEIIRLHREFGGRRSVAAECSGGMGKMLIFGPGYHKTTNWKSINFSLHLVNCTQLLYFR